MKDLRQAIEMAYDDTQRTRAMLSRFRDNAQRPDLSPGQRAYWQRMFDLNKDKFPALRLGASL
jgi:hypothetical protein